MKPNDILTDFLLNQIPAHVLGSYKLMASLKYPIPDKHTLIQQLNQGPDLTTLSPDEKTAKMLVLDSLKAVDFPMQTARSGLEKLFERIDEPLLPERETVARPDIIDVLNETFSARPDCAHRAIEAFLDCYDGPGTELNCIIFAMQEGNRCLD